MKRVGLIFKLLILSGMVGVVLAACRPVENAPPTEVSATKATEGTIPSVESSTLLPPTPTPLPMAVLVNGEGITLVEYQAELARYQAAVGRELTADDERFVLDNLISEMLLAQAATENGFVVDEQLLQERLDHLIEGIGGKANFDDWLSENHYDEESFRTALGRSIASAWMRDQIAATVSETMEQVHAQQILVTNAQEANEIIRRLEAGADFTAIAYEYDPDARGDLSWFPHGYLFEPLVEQAAFALEPGQYSGVIETDTGYHIIFVIERDPERPLTPDARLRLQEKALKEWLAERWDESDIQVLDF